jgi:hypothetical protein
VVIKMDVAYLKTQTGWDSSCMSPRCEAVRTVKVPNLGMPKQIMYVEMNGVI